MVRMIGLLLKHDSRRLRI